MRMLQKGGKGKSHPKRKSKIGLRKSRKPTLSTHELSHHRIHAASSFCEKLDQKH